VIEEMGKISQKERGSITGTLSEEIFLYDTEFPEEGDLLKVKLKQTGRGLRIIEGRFNHTVSTRKQCQNKGEQDEPQR